jgi:hypothetical protein
MWKNILERLRPRMTMRRMRIAFWKPKATNTHSEYVCFSTATLIALTRLYVTFYVQYIASLIVRTEGRTVRATASRRPVFMHLRF